MQKLNVKLPPQRDEASCRTVRRTDGGLWECGHQKRAVSGAVSFVRAGLHDSYESAVAWLDKTAPIPLGVRAWK